MGLKYYTKIEDSPIHDLLRQAIIKTHNQFMVLSDSIWKECPCNGISTGASIVFYQGGPIDHFTHVTCPVDQSSAESENNASCTAGMYLKNSRMLNHELFNKDKYVVSEKSPLIISNGKSEIFMSMNVKDTKHTRHISRRRHF